MELLLAELDGGTALIQRRAGDVDVHIRAADPAVAEKLALEVANGAYTTTRRIEAPAWASIADHYPGEVGAQIGELVDLRLSLDGGRIVLWHGLPGTGKTTAIRALAREWEPDCRFQVVLDPDVVFARSSVLITTNEPIGRIHPALLRPGRCLAETEFRAFSRTEACALFGDDVPARGDLTLARLLGGDGPDGSDDTQDEVPTGLHL
ncbi:MAG: hypothetical protein GY713_14705 [Actinomycetia bacterium]|nr:hypothetical protein [Actinomycetes bacterium]